MASQSSNLRVPPQDLDAEKAVLGSIMLRPGALYEISDLVVPDSFYAEKHKKIFGTMQELSDKGEPIDLLSLSTRLKEKRELDGVGGRTYLTELISSVPASTNIKHYAKIVHKKFILRNLIETADFVAKIGFDESEDSLDNLLDKVEKKVFNVLTSPQYKTTQPIKETLSEAWERIEKLHESKEGLRGIPTGFRDLDNLLAGFQKSDMITLAARPSMGKTTLALDIARHVAVENNIPVGIFSLEMSAQQLVDRMLASESRVNAWSLRTGRLRADEEFSKIRDSLDKLSKAPLFIDDTPSISINQIRSTARKLKMEHNLGLLIVDYLQLMTTPKEYDSMVNQVTEISRSLKSIARELEIPVLALSQLSRAIESRGGKPRLSDLRDSGSIEQDSDVVMFIHREDRYKEESERPNVAEILVEKHRNGPIGKIELYFDPKTVTFLTLEKSDLDELDTFKMEEEVESD